MRDGTKPIGDEYMKEMLGQSKHYTIVLLRPGATYAETPEVGEVVRIMGGDPGVAAGVFTYEAHPIRSFAGDGLPE
jgi:hypothetical protein